MRWSIFAIAAYLTLVLQVGLGKSLAFSSGYGSIQPEFTLLLAVFVALCAPTRATVIACGALGFFVDLVASPYATLQPESAAGAAPTAVTLIGPYTLGYMTGGYLVVQLRPMLVRHHPLTLAAMSITAGAEAHLVVLGLLWVRQFYEPMTGFDAADQLLPRALSLLYTAALGLLFALPMFWSAPAFGFHHARGQGPGVRGQ